MKVTIKQLAQMAGVSHPTVSKALNNEPGISKQTRDKIIDLAKQYNYTSCHMAKKNSEHTNNIIGLVWPKYEGLFFYHLSREIQLKAEEAGINILQSFSNLEDALILFNECNIDKVAVWLAPEWVPDADFLNKRESFDGRLLVLGGGRLHQANHITVDRKAGIHMAVEYLAQLGHKRVAFFSEHKNDKLFGFTQGLLEFKLEYYPEYIITVDNEFAVKEGFQKLWEGNIRPTALIIDSQGILFKVMKLLKDFKVKIPDDISIIVYDDIPEMEMFDTPLSVIGPSIKRLALETVKILTEAESDNGLTEVDISPELTVRASTKEIISK